MTRSILHASELNRSELETLIERAFDINAGMPSSLLGRRAALVQHHAQPIPSAWVMQELGRAGVTTETVQIHPQIDLDKVGETIRKINPHLVLFSHPLEGSAHALAEIVTVPVLNCGDGANQNPGLALLELFAIRRAVGSLAHKRIALLGNLKLSARAHSFAQLACRLEANLSLVSPAALSMPYDLTEELRATGIEVEETNDLETTLRKTDVLYMSGLHQTSVGQPLHQKFRDFYQVSQSVRASARPDLAILGDWHQELDQSVTSRLLDPFASCAMLCAVLEYCLT